MMRLSYSYLFDQFSHVDDIISDLRVLVSRGEFTLGPYVEMFEQKFARYIGCNFAIGTNTGTDALILGLKALGITSGDEVITVPNTFAATVGAIVAVGASPVFVDCDSRYQIDVDKLASVITPRTRAIIPVHWAGAPADIQAVMDIARQFDLFVIEDACPSTGARVGPRSVGTFGKVGAFSFHPLKPLNVWGDGGILVTDDEQVASFLRLYRNHGLLDRDHVEFWGINNRLQPIQALVASHMLDRLETDIAARIRNARRLDEAFRSLTPFVRCPPRPGIVREVYQLYIVSVDRRDELLVHLHAHGIEARVHYPIPLHLQRAAESLGYKRGDFPVCESQASEIITLPAHPYISDDQLDYMIATIRDFYC